jgi:nucleoside-diphosphate-sugar epimerase
MSVTEQRSRIILTGFTGVLGKRFAYRLAALGYEVVCPIRAGSEAEAKSRFQTVFHGMRDLVPGFDESLSGRIRAIPGDVREKGLGIPSALLEELRGPRTRSIWHLAACLDLTETKSQDVYDTNFLGTLHVLEFAKAQGIGELHYFSTFGSSGKLHEGIVREIPGIRPPSFRNTYERTKWEAERQIWQSQVRGEIQATIYRPSIVVGDSLFGRYEQFNVFNHPFDIASSVRTRLCKKQHIDPRTGTLHYDLRLPGDENHTLNIVPLDFVMDTVMKIYAVPGSTGRVYHIVNPNPPSLRLTMEIFKRNEPWEGLRWEKYRPEDGFLNPFEKFIARQLAFLAPYLQGEPTYDYSNVQAILAFHGGLPPLDNDTFLDAISKRGILHGWQEVRADAAMAARLGRHGELESDFVWPEGSGPVVDFAPHHPVEELAPPPPSYTTAERLLGKAYLVQEMLFSLRRKGANDTAVSGARDLVLVPFGMGTTRRGEAENYCYHSNPKLADQVFEQMNQTVGFDLRAFARRPIPGHEHHGDLHDACCWAVTDDLIHVLRLFRDIQQTGGAGFVPRLQILPHSAGTYLAGWLSGIVSFQDMALIAHQCSHLMSENVRLSSLEETDHWFFDDRMKLTATERTLLQEIRQQVDPLGELPRDALASRLNGDLELVFSLSSHMLKKLIADVHEHRIGVSVGITMSPNAAVFVGNALEMARFHQLFTGIRKLELKRVMVDAKGTPHCQRLARGARHAAELLKIYDEQGRLHDPVVPLLSCTGEVVRTRQAFIEAITGIADQPLRFDAMIEKALDTGGRHFVLIQSGMSSAAGDLFNAIIRNHANVKGIKAVHIYQPALLTAEPHPVCEILEKRADAVVPEAAQQSMADTTHWYEHLLSEAQSATRGRWALVAEGPKHIGRDVEPCEVRVVDGEVAKVSGWDEHETVMEQKSKIRVST